MKKIKNFKIVSERDFEEAKVKCYQVGFDYDDKIDELRQQSKDFMLLVSEAISDYGEVPDGLKAHLVGYVHEKKYEEVSELREQKDDAISNIFEKYKNQFGIYDENYRCFAIVDDRYLIDHEKDFRLSNVKEWLQEVNKHVGEEINGMVFHKLVVDFNGEIYLHLGEDMFDSVYFSPDIQYDVQCAFGIESFDVRNIRDIMYTDYVKRPDDYIDIIDWDEYRPFKDTNEYRDGYYRDHILFPINDEHNHTQSVIHRYSRDGKYFYILECDVLGDYKALKKLTPEELFKNYVWQCPKYLGSTNIVLGVKKRT